MTDEAVELLDGGSVDIDYSAPTSEVSEPSSSVAIDSSTPAAEVDSPSQEAVVGEERESVEVATEGGMASLDYRQLANKPSINSVTLISDKSLDDIGVCSITNTEIRDLVGRHR